MERLAQLTKNDRMNAFEPLDAEIHFAKYRMGEEVKFSISFIQLVANFHRIQFEEMSRNYDFYSTFKCVNCHAHLNFC